MMLAASGAFGTTISGTEMTVAGSLLINLPGLGNVDYTASLKSVDFDTQDTTSYPNDISERSGFSDTGGSAVLAGPVNPRDEKATWVSLMNPDDPSSSLYRQSVKGSPLTFDFGVQSAGSAPELIRRVTGKVQSWVVDVVAGTVTVQFIDLTDDWDQLPALPGVIIAAPFNAGLTSEYVIDRIARAASGGAVSSWPAQRANCLLSVGLRTSLWPEKGTLAIASDQPSPAFGPGPYGSGLTTVAAGLGYNFPTYLLATPLDSTTTSMFMEALVSGLAAGGQEVDVDVGAGSVSGLGFSVTSGGMQNASGTASFVTALDSGPHYVSALFTLHATTYDVTFTVDAATHAVTGLSYAGLGKPGSSSNWDQGVIQVFNGAAVAGVQITTETAPASNYPFTPQAILDPSLSTLQAVPAIDAGTKTWDELQAIAEAEMGFVCRDNLGRLLFLNRNTILNQTPGRTITLKSLKSIQTSVGAATEYNDIAIDYTEYAWAAATTVFQPTVKWKIPALSTRTWQRTLLDGETASVTDGPINLLPDGTNPNNGNHWYRVSRDQFGNTEHGLMAASVVALTPSTVQITFTNNGRNDAWLVSPANNLDMLPGTISLWIGGRPVAPDEPTTIHVSYGTASPTYTVPPSTYRQDRDATQDVGTFLLGLLRTARPTYDGVGIVPDARLVVPDKVTVSVPLPDGSTAAVDMLIWGLSFSADFEQAAWDMSLDLRRVYPPGAWVLGVAGASELAQTTWLY